MKTLVSNEKIFSINNRLKSFTYAWAGIKAVFSTEHNTWIHLFLTVLAAVFSIVLKINSTELMALVIVIAMVWTAELFNTCIEKSMDFITTETHPKIKLIKDVAAAAVLLASFTALIIGGIIFLPKIF